MAGGYQIPLIFGCAFVSAAGRSCIVGIAMVISVDNLLHARGLDYWIQTNENGVRHILF